MDRRHSSWIKKIREFALDHYEESGWDYVIECWSDADLSDIFFDDGCESYDEAFLSIKERVDLFGDRRSEIEATAW